MSWASSGVSLGVVVFLIGRDAIAAVHDPAAIGLLHVLRIDLAVFAAQIFEQALMLIVALDETAAGRVVFGDGQQQGAVAGEWEGACTKPLPKVLSPNTHARS